MNSISDDRRKIAAYDSFDVTFKQGLLDNAVFPSELEARAFVAAWEG